VDKNAAADAFVPRHGREQPRTGFQAAREEDVIGQIVATIAHCARYESRTLFKLITGELLIGSLAAAVSSCQTRGVECCSLFPAFDHVVTVWRQLI
jgi:hypothetical protein